MDGRDYIQSLEASFESGVGSGAIRELCETTASLLMSGQAEFSKKEATESLELLRETRRFAEMLMMAEALLYRYDNVPELQRHYGQALIENNHLLAAIQWLGTRELNLRETADPASKKEWEEFVGLLGRAHKQLYTERKKPADLLVAISWYNYLYAINPEAVWHGINVVCLVALAEANQISLDSLEKPINYREVANDILQILDAKPDKDHWDYITMAEAQVALEQPEDALPFLIKYCDLPEVGAFEIGAPLRQFDDLWDLDERDGAYRVIVDILRSALMRKNGGEIIVKVDKISKLTAQHADRRQTVLTYEKLFTDAGPLPAVWFLQAAECSKMAGRIWLKSLHGVGSGFLLNDGGVLYEPWKGFQVFVTCNHVVSNKHNSAGALFADEVTITFDELDTSKAYNPFRHTVKKVLWESPRTEFDVTILQLNDVEERVEDLPVTVITDHSRIPQETDERIYIIGHPKGGQLSFSFQDNRLIDVNERRIQYITPTEPGSSGSPVFDQDLNLIAMHHAGAEFMESLSDPGKTRKANQGIPIPAIIQQIQAGESATT